MQIALADLPEDARQRSRLMRKEDQQRREQEKASKAAQIEAELEERKMQQVLKVSTWRLMLRMKPQMRQLP